MTQTKDKPFCLEKKKRKVNRNKGVKRTLEQRRINSECHKGIKMKEGFKCYFEGKEPWNKKNKPHPKREVVYYKGRNIPKTHRIWCIFNRKERVPEGFVLHHKDENPFNDDIKNLRLMRNEDHHYLHNILELERQKMRTALAELIKGVKQDFKEVKLDGCEVVVYRRIGSHFGKSLMPSEAKA